MPRPHHCFKHHGGSRVSAIPAAPAGRDLSLGGGFLYLVVLICSLPMEPHQPGVASTCVLQESTVSQGRGRSLVAHGEDGVFQSCILLWLPPLSLKPGSLALSMHTCLNELSWPCME